MDKKDLDLLERAFATEIDSALKGTPRLMQTRAVSRAQKLVDCNLLAHANETWRGIVMRGYELTHAGRLTYCATCNDPAAP